MDMHIDTDATFRLGSDRVATVDAYELSVWKEGVFKDKGEKRGDTNYVGPEVFVPLTQAYFKEKCDVELSYQEANLIFRKAHLPWEMLQKNSQEGSADASPSSPLSTAEDPRFAA
jgi:hypothetical protein